MLIEIVKSYRAVCEDDVNVFEGEVFEVRQISVMMYYVETNWGLGWIPKQCAVVLTERRHGNEDVLRDIKGFDSRALRKVICVDSFLRDIERYNPSSLRKVIGVDSLLRDIKRFDSRSLKKATDMRSLLRDIERFNSLSLKSVCVDRISCVLSDIESYDKRLLRSINTSSRLQRNISILDEIHQFDMISLKPITQQSCYGDRDSHITSFVVDLIDTINARPEKFDLLHSIRTFNKSTLSSHPIHTRKVNLSDERFMTTFESKYRKTPESSIHDEIVSFNKKKLIPTQTKVEYFFLMVLEM